MSFIHIDEPTFRCVEQGEIESLEIPQNDGLQLIPGIHQFMAGEKCIPVDITKICLVPGKPGALKITFHAAEPMALANAAGPDLSPAEIRALRRSTPEH